MPGDRAHPVAHPDLRKPRIAMSSAAVRRNICASPSGSSYDMFTSRSASCCSSIAIAPAVALVLLAALGFISERNGAATIMSAMCLGGLVAGGIVGVPGRVLLPVAFGFMGVIWITKIDPPANGNAASAFAHAIGGGLVGCALVENRPAGSPPLSGQLRASAPSPDRSHGHKLTYAALPMPPRDQGQDSVGMRDFAGPPGPPSPARIAPNSSSFDARRSRGVSGIAPLAMDRPISDARRLV